jgi:hypothetical protein
VKEVGEREGSLFVSGGDAAVLFQPAEHTLDLNAIPLAAIAKRAPRDAQWLHVEP